VVRVLFTVALNSPQNQSLFDPASPATHSIVNLAILVFAITGLIFVVVEGVLFYAIWRFSQNAADPTSEPPQVYGSQAIEIAWTAAPTLIVLFLTLVITRSLWEVNPTLSDAMPQDNALLVTVTGRQWWWEYTYETYNGRKLGFATANELHMPVSEDGVPRPVHLILKSADVCHSYWVPRLAGKVDLIPGRANSLLLQTHETGLYLGQCAEYCGTQHANMLIRVVVDSSAQFDRWLENQALPSADAPDGREGKQVFLTQSCVNCHGVRGTPAQGTYAPDLTHLMSRQSLASGEIKNSMDDLKQWVRDPQAIKPGCLMPAFGLSSRDQDLIVQYLGTLR
jgi:cytochrome c oxidase subunit 2